MAEDKIYDCAIIGGGLAGLTLSIQLSAAGYSVILLEKEAYPFHKVCGEYISLESWPFLERLGLPLSSMNLPIIKKLIVTSPNGTTLRHELPLGGFGISRYTIDNELKTIASRQGVNVVEQCKVEDVIFEKHNFVLQTNTGIVKSKVCCGSFGKRSNLDIKWKRNFINKSTNKLNNYVGVKYHVNAGVDDETISLHNFKDGYCGISKIEDGKYCLCYLTNAANLKKSGNSIEQMEKQILANNPYLKNILLSSEKLYRQPLSISQISFQQKTQIENHVLMIGDAAGMITPLCGNGMSMAMHGGKIAFAHIDNYLKNKISREQMEKNFAKEWKKTFAERLRTGRIIQRFFGNTTVTNVFVFTMKLFPRLTGWLIRKTHGEPF